MKTIQIHPLDNVAVALTPIAKGESVTAGEYTVIAGGDIPQGHKIALKKIEKDTDRDYIMTPAEALEYGMIDKVVSRDAIK